MLDAKIKPFYNPSDLDVVIGDDVIKLNPNGDFNLHFPIRRGDFNLHGGVGGSITAVIADLQEIWEYVLETYLKIPLRFDTKNLKFAFLIRNVQYFSAICICIRPF